jgi:hypothetical protein
MFIAILQHTPIRVWALLGALIALGLTQARDREIGLLLVTILPLAMVAVSASGVLSAFGHFPVALGGWATGLAAALSLARNAVAVRGARWSTETGLLHVPGSWLPLALIVGLFWIKYIAGVSMAINPALALDARFAGPCSLAYGAFSGLFLARALPLLRLATRRTGLSRRSEAPMKLRSAGDSLRGSLRRFDHQMPLSL